MMKFILIVTLVIFSTTIVTAQVYGGGNRRTSSQKTDFKESRQSRINDQVYVAFNIAIPMLDEDNTYKGYLSTGLGIDFGIDNYFRLPLPETMRVGFDYGFSLHLNPMNQFEDAFLSVDTKLGLVYTYEIAEDITFDVKLTLKPTLLGVLEYNDLERYIGVRKGIGVYTNYKFLRFGVEFSGGNLTDNILDYSYYDINLRRLDISLGFKF